MSITGPVPVNITSHQTDANALTLRVQERISAEVIKVAGDRVLLSVDGVRLVARMTTPDQTAQLAEKRHANFIIKDFSQEILTLQLVNSGGEQSGTSASISIVPMLLEQSGLALDETNVLIANTLLQKGLPVNAQLVTEIREMLLSMGEVNIKAAQLAVAMKADGLLISPEVLALVLNHTPQITDSLKSLIKTIFSLSRRPGSGIREELLQDALKTLQTFFIDLNSSSDEIASQLDRLFNILGRSVENRLRDLLQDGAAALNPNSQPDEMLKLIRLYHAIHDHPELHQLKDELERFFDSLRVMQYTNTEPDPAAQHAGWLRIELPLAFHTLQPPYMAESDQTCQLQIAYRREDDGTRTIDPRHTRMVISTGLGENDIIAIDLSIVKQNLQAKISASNIPLKTIAEDELSSLEENLSNKGFTVLSSSCHFDPELKVPQRFELEELIPNVSPQSKYTKVNVEA